MQIAYLKRSPIIINDETVGETFSLIEGNNANETATLKARTLLAYLWDSGELPVYTHNDWCIYCTLLLDNEHVIKTIVPHIQNAPSEAVAIMPVKYMEDSDKQYGVIAIRKDENLQRIFVNSYLDSSRKWLQTHAAERKKLSYLVK